ncbi:hypothetical protein C8Q76DRAFT_821822 [Earliella scabrosa]|nr:hypothetical protein C8Q76DRAFT_821822 [Earliella scabrosa]
MSKFVLLASLLLTVVLISLASTSRAHAASLSDTSIPTLVTVETTTAAAAIDVDALPDCAGIPLTNSTELQSHMCKVPVDVAAKTLEGSAGERLAARQSNDGVGCFRVAPDSNDGRQLCVNSGLPGSVSLNAASPTSCICTVWTRATASFAACNCFACSGVVWSGLSEGCSRIWNLCTFIDNKGGYFTVVNPNAFLSLYRQGTPDPKPDILPIETC